MAATPTEALTEATTHRCDVCRRRIRREWVVVEPVADMDGYVAFVGIWSCPHYDPKLHD